LTTRDRWLPVGALAAAVYVPLLCTAPGRVGADTKSYLYLDPARLLSRAWSMWDPSIGLGTVSHQTIGYLWPMGPWFWAFDKLGVPDWVAQRLWLGSLLFAAGTGVLWLLRRVLGWSTAPAVAAAFVYACTPYLLTLAARLSVILLPWAGLPWLVGLAALSVRSWSWRYPAAFALVVASVGSVNATALVLVGVGPLLWLLHARLVGEASTGTIVRAAGRIGILTAAANLWWIAGLWAQGGYGIEILRYTETAEVVASASVAVEVLRGLGYWFFYGGDRLGPWIEPGSDYTQRLPLLSVTYALPLGALVAGAFVRWRDRVFFVALTVVGTLAAVGAHPWDRPPPAGRVVRAVLESDAGLAMRSLPRAAPLVALGLAALLGAGVGALAERVRPRAAFAVALAAYLALPPLWVGAMVPSNLDRPEDVPSYWREVAAYLDARGDTTRVLEIPGVDFASYRWGNTVDPITPGLMDRPYVARELIPYGSPASADLLAALDRRLQERTLTPGALAVVARLMGVGDVVLRGDLQFERYRTPRPYDLEPFLLDEPGLGEPVTFGTPVVNRPVPDVPLLDELALLADDNAPRPPVSVFPVDDAVPIVRAVGEGGVVVAGDGEGLVDVTAAGLLEGDELVRYGASLGAAGVSDALDGGAALVITDGNRRQGRRWSTVRDTLGYVEGAPALVDDLTDNRLPVFPDAEPGWETTAPSTAAATSYGNRTSFTPEYRPANAIDGDLRTEWRTGANADVRGERLELTYSPAVDASSVTLVQQLSGFRNRAIAVVDVSVDGGEAVRVQLGEASSTPEGQEVPLPGGPVSQLTIEVVRDNAQRTPAWGRPARYTGLSQIGFAEVRLDGAVTNGPEPLVLPPAALDALGADTPAAIVLTRWRTDPSEVVRQDPEPGWAREWTQPVARTWDLSGTAAASPRAPDAALDAVFGTTGPVVTSTSRLAGAVTERGSAVLDGDPSTWWSPAFDDAQRAVTVDAGAPVTFDVVDIEVVDDGRRSVPTAIRIEADGAAVATVAPGRTELDEPITGTTFRFVVEAVDERTTTEWFSNASVAVPPAIAELGIPELAVDVPSTLRGDCRADLLELDGRPVPVRIVRGQIESCDGPLRLGAGEHTLVAAPGIDTGIDLDQLVLTSSFAVDTAPGPDVEVLDDGRASVHVRVDGATPGEPFWLVLGQSHNLGWDLDGRQPELIDGYAAGWLVTPTASSFELTAEWRPQRVVTAALVASAAAVVLCVVLAARRTVVRAPIRTTAEFTRAGRIGARQSWAVAVVAGVLSLLWIGPVAALVVAAVSFAAARWLRLAPAVAFAGAVAYVLARQVLAAPAPAFEWPAELETAHQPALVAVALLAVVVALDARQRR
jgi:arabinofuranan 3-O-arabinosyltransferase